MKTITLLFFGFFLTEIVAQNWEQVQSVPSPGRDDGAAFSINGFGYLVTGNHNGFSESNKLFKYKPISNSWEEGTSFPGEARQYAGSFVIDGKAYVFSGLSASGDVLNDVWEFNSATSDWKRLNDFPGHGRWSFFTFSTNEFGFLGAGITIAFGNISDCWKYNPKNDQWSPIKEYPEGNIREIVGFCLGDDCYAGTGLTYNPLSFSKKFYHYNVQEDSWSPIQDFPGAARSYAQAENIGNTAIVGGGWGNQNEYFRDAYSFSKNEGWKKIDDFPIQGWRGMSSFSVNNSAYFLTGLYENQTRTSDVMKYTFSDDPSAVIYPNPTSENSILYNSFGGLIEIFDFGGNLVEQLSPIDEGFHTLPKLSSGVYIVKVSNSKDQVLLKWIIL
jgi:N-acetylneuraminic acid mutarotase